LHIGKIWATHNQNVGSCFHFTIPLNQGGPTFIQEEDEMKTDSIKNKNQNNINILMIDDEDACLESMELLLMETGFNFVKAKGGTEGLKYIRSSENIIDLILLDLMMPDVYGLNVLEELKKDTKFNNIPIILQTGTSDQAEIAQAFSMGVVGYLKKPYNKGSATVIRYLCRRAFVNIIKNIAPHFIKYLTKTSGS
jgi:two-component system sensor histidine kinase ChiS